jgi:hypothetical protein
MRNWDPMAVMKYLTGAPALHAVMLFSYYTTQPFEHEQTAWIDDINVRHPMRSKIYEEKTNLISRLYLGHMVCLISSIVFESGLFEVIMGL